MYFFVVRRDGGGHEADAVDHAVALEAKLGAVLLLDLHKAVADLGDGGVQIDGHLLERQHLPEEGGVGKAGAGGGDEVVGVLHDDGVLAPEHHLVGRLAGGLSAAEEHDAVTGVHLIEKELGEVDGLVEALHRQRLGGGAGADEDLVELPAEGGGIVDLHVEAHLDVVLHQLPLVPAEESLVRFLEAHGGGGDIQAAQRAGLFEDDGDMTTLFQHQRALHTADAAADDRHPLGLAGGDDLIFIVLHGGGGQGAARQMEGVVHGLHIGRAPGLVEAEAGVVAVDAGLDVLHPILNDLVDPLGVHKVLAGDAHGVQPTGGDLLRRLLRVHLTGADHGLGGEALDMLHLREIAVLRHIDRGMRPVPRVVGAVVAVEHIVACVLQILDGALGFRHVPSELGELLAGDGTLSEALGLGHHGVAQSHREILAADRLDRLHDLYGEAVAVLEGAAVFIGAVVHVGDGELIQQVALVHRVDRPPSGGGTCTPDTSGWGWRRRRR